LFFVRRQSSIRPHWQGTPAAKAGQESPLGGYGKRCRYVVDGDQQMQGFLVSGPALYSQRTLPWRGEHYIQRQVLHQMAYLLVQPQAQKSGGGEYNGAVLAFH
jgi:hypothetical protein